MSDIIRRDDDPVLSQFRLRNPLTERFNMFQGLWRRIRLAWRLVRDPRVKLYVKAIPVGILIYIISPVDLMPVFVTGLIGVVDDVILLTLGLDLFFRLVPDDVLLEHARALGFGEQGG